MKLLYISPSPPNEMERVRSLNILKALKKKNVNITLITLYNSKQEKYIANAEKYVDNIIKVKYSKIVAIFYAFISLFLPVPVRVGYCFNFRLRKILKTMQYDFDVAYIKRLRMAQYKKYLRVQTVYIDITDSLTKCYERLAKAEKGIKKLVCLEEFYKHKIYEKKICENNENIIICSEDDKKYLKKLSSKIIGKITVIDNVIDVQKWTSDNIKVSNPGERNRLAFLGVMNYEPNVLGVKYLIKNVLPKLPNEYSLNVVGARVPKELKKFENERVKFLGYVDSVKEELSKYDIFICPIIAGAGTKNKILQAGAMGLPIVCTQMSLEGLTQELKDVVFVANTEEEFVKQISKIDSMDEKDLLKILERQVEIIRKNNSMEMLEEKFRRLIIE